MSPILPDWSRTVELLDRLLDGPLPGPAAQETMAPRPRPGWTPGGFPDGCREAAVLVLVFPRDGAPWFVLTRRTDTLDHHRGQISLPGGAFENGEDAVACALRETEEELGVAVPDARILGLLSPLHVPVSGFRVTPVVAALAHRPGFDPAHAEVAAVHETPLAHLLDPARLRWDREHPRAGPSWLDIPWFDLDAQFVWGATAMMLAELRALLEPMAAPERDR